MVSLVISCISTAQRLDAEQLWMVSTSHRRRTNGKERRKKAEITPPPTAKTRARAGMATRAAGA